jgi:hypothetical protein
MELAWHFVGPSLRDGRPIPPDGVWLRHEGPIQICYTGLHASPRVIDALRYAPGATICRDVVRDVVTREADKLVARDRAILWRVDASATLLAFSRRCALSVIDLWDAPEVVRRYLETGDDALRVEAAEAARAAAEAARAAAEAARAAARAARAAWAVAWAAETAWAAAGAARASGAAWAASWAAETAWAAARAAWAAEAAWVEQDGWLEAMVREAAGNPDDDALLAALREDA